MPGTYCNGVETDQPFVKESQAYCEGMLYRASGAGAAVPITDNPYTVTGRPTEKAAWDRGWNAANGEAGGNIPASVAGCCAARGLAVQV